MKINLLKKEKNFNSICHSCVSENPAGNKVLHTSGSSGSADAAPRMTKNKQYAAPRMTVECGFSTPSLSLRGGFANEAIPCRLPRPIGLAMTEQVGRSMVEMLGVLAVMGVLSVAGIAGYNTAMSKHRANELLNEASKRAVVVAGQFLNRDTASLAEFSGHNSVAGATFTDTTATKDANNQFTLTITGVSEAVCNHMQNMKTALIQKFEPSDCATTATVKLTYNADLSMGSSSGNSGGNESGTTTPACDPACTGGCQQCNGGKCISTCKIGEYCMSNSNSDFECVAFKKCNNSSECPKKAPCCSNNACVVNTCPEGSEWYQYGPDDYGCKDINNTITSGTCSSTIKGCSSNSDCDTPNEFCSVDTNNWSCSGPLGIGQCTPVGIVNTVSGKTGNAAQYNGYIYSSIKMNWWSANNWCEAQGKRLVSLSDLGIIGGYEDGWCTLNTCQGADWDALYDAFGHEYWWTTERRDNDSCEVFYIETTTSYQAPVQTTSILGERPSLCL